MTSPDTVTYPRSFPAAGPLDVSIRLGSGNVAVTASDTTEAVVDLMPAQSQDPDALELIERSRVELRGTSLVIHVPDRHGLLRRTPAILVRATVPTGSNLTAGVGSADVEVEGTIGTLDVQSGSADVSAATCGDTRVRTGSGDVRLREVRDASVTSGSGDIRIDRSAGDIQLQSGSGDILVGDAGGDGRLSTGSGDVDLGTTRGVVVVKTASGEVTVERATEGQLVVNTASGDVAVGIPEGTVARLECSSVTGRVHSQLEPSDAPADTERRLILNARTVTGAITVHRAPA